MVQKYWINQHGHSLYEHQYYTSTERLQKYRKTTIVQQDYNREARLVLYSKITIVQEENYSTIRLQ